MLKLTAKLLLLAGAVTVGQLWLRPEPRQRDGMVGWLDAGLNLEPGVYYFCDSTNAAVDPRDDDHHSVAQFAQQMLGDGETLVDVHHYGYYMELYLGMYKYVLRRESENGSRHKAVVIPINLRTFGATWDLCPTLQFQTTKVFMQIHGDPLLEAFHRPMETFGVLMEKPLTMEEYEDLYFYDGDRRVGRVGDYINDFQGRAKVGYQCRIDENHRNLVAMRRIVELARQHDDVVLFYFPPVNYHLGESVSGEEFNERVAENVEHIKQLLAGHEPAPLDLVFSLPAECFTGGSWDHTNAAGRRYVAGFLAEALSRQLDIPVDRESVLASRRAISAGHSASGRLAARPKPRAKQDNH